MTEQKPPPQQPAQDTVRKRKAPGNTPNRARKKPSTREKVLARQPDDHIAQLLLEGEEILRVATIHPAIYWKAGAVFVLALILLVLAFNLGVLLLIVSALMFSVAHVTKYFLMLVLTNKRVLIRYGVIKLDVVQIHHRKIESVELAWTILGQILGYASIMITGTGSRVSIVPFIADAPAFRRELEQILLEIEEGRSYRAEDHD